MQVMMLALQCWLLLSSVFICTAFSTKVLELKLEGIYESKSPNHIQEYSLETKSPVQMFSQSIIRLQSVQDPSSEAKRWPDITDKQTLLTLANVSHQAYVRPDENKTFITNEDWEKDEFGQEDGVRGVVYVDSEQKLVVVGIKGTSIYLSKISFDPSAHKDRINDNMMFGCCPAGKYRDNVPFTTTINCETGPRECNYDCFAQASRNFTESYWAYLQSVYSHLRRKYPNSQFWFTGHSLGGALASLMGAAHKVPAVTFNAVGEAMFAKRIGLDMDRIYGNEDDRSNSTHINDRLPIYHFGTVFDPIFMGRASGLSRFGYTIETKCHFGKVCYFDPKTLPKDIKVLLKLNGQEEDYRLSPLFQQGNETVRSSRYNGWLLRNLLFHRIANFVNVMRKFEDVPACQVQQDCTDCESYTYL